MTLSEGIRFTLLGRELVVRVARKDGYCWGRVYDMAGKLVGEITTRTDYYECPDAMATEGFIHKANAYGFERPVAAVR